MCYKAGEKEKEFGEGSFPLNSFYSYYIQWLHRIRRPSHRVVDLYSVGAITAPAHNKAAGSSGAGSVTKAKPSELLRSLADTGGEENGRCETSSPEEAGRFSAPPRGFPPLHRLSAARLLV